LSSDASDVAPNSVEVSFPPPSKPPAAPRQQLIDPAPPHSALRRACESTPEFPPPAPSSVELAASSAPLSENSTRGQVFRCHRFSKGLLRRPSFAFYSGTTQLYAAKFKNRGTICVKEGPSGIHITDGQFSHFVNVLDGKTRFLLRQFEPAADLCALTISQADPTKPRALFLKWMSPPREYVNLRPRFNLYRTCWELHFDGRYVIKSNKNAVFIDESQAHIFICRKIGKDDLELEMI
jgi:hypothetical protein